jgi:ferredoxin-NADP reductase
MSISRQALSADSIGVTFIYTRTSPPHWPRPPGRIDATLLAEASWPSTLSPTCYMCGPTSFVERAAGLLTALGHSPAPNQNRAFWTHRNSAMSSRAKREPPIYLR